MALNGRLDDADLGYVTGTGHRVRADLVPQTVALRAAFAFRFGKPLAITDSYRAYSGHYYAQVETFLRRYVRTWLPGRPTKTWNGVTYWQLPGTAMAATPGTSNHGWGAAIDFGAGVNRMGSPEHDWMVANAPRFGWHWPKWWAKDAGEAWHFEAVPVPASNYARDLVDVAAPTIPDLPTPLAPEDDDMLIIQRNNADGSKSLLAGGGWRGPLGRYSVQALEALDVETKVLSAQDYDTLLSLLPALEVDKLADAVVARLPKSGIDQPTVEAALKNVLRHGVAD